MTITLLAPDGVAVTAKQERQARAATYAGVPSRPLGGLSGFGPGTASDTLTATSTTWTLKPCAAMIDPGATTHQGMYGWASDANITGTVTAADATNPRKDIVYIQVNDSTSGDGSGAVSYAPQYLAGTPGTTPTAPTLPPRSFLVGTITVPKATTGSPTVILNPARFAAAGGIIPVNTTAERNAIAGYEGLQVYRSDTQQVETFTGGAWRDGTRGFSPLSPSSWSSTGDITITPEGTKRRVIADLVITRTGGDFTLPTGSWTLVGGDGMILPAGAQGSAPVKYLSVAVVGGGNNFTANVAFNPNGVVSIRAVTAFTFTTNAFFTINVAYYI